MGDLLVVIAIFLLAVGILVFLAYASRCESGCGGMVECLSKIARCMVSILTGLFALIILLMFSVALLYLAWLIKLGGEGDL